MSLPPPYTEKPDDNELEGNNTGVSWWCKILVRTAASFAGVACIALGIWKCITFIPLGIVAGFIQILLGLMVLLFEVPICCQQFKITQPISRFAAARTHFQKAILFAGVAIIPVALSFSMATVVGCGLVFAVGVLYGLISLGKKADMETMRARASEDDKVAIIPNIVVQN